MTIWRHVLLIAWLCLVCGPAFAAGREQRAGAAAPQAAAAAPQAAAQAAPPAMPQVCSEAFEAKTPQAMIDGFTACLKANPDANTQFSAFFNRASSYSRLGQPQLALVDFEQALKLKPEFALGYLMRGDIYLWTLGDYPRAAQDLKLAYKLQPDHPEIISSLAWVYAACPDPSYLDGKKALELSRKLVEMGREPRRLNTLAASLARVGQFKEAVQVQEEAMAQLLMQGLKAEQMPSVTERLALYKAGKAYTIPKR